MLILLRLVRNVNEETVYRCVNADCRKIINKNTSYMSKSNTNFGGRMVWCKTCMNKQYMDYWLKYGDVRRALWCVCRKYDIPFIKDKFNMAITQTTEKDYGSEKIFSYYMQKLYSLQHRGEKCFDDGITVITQNINGINVEGEESRIKKWGNYESKDLDFLDYELEDWQKTHSCENKAELTLLKEICIKQLEIRKVRSSSGVGDTSKLIKELQELMKTANVDPAKANAINAGKSVDCYGVWVRDFEDKSPAEWFEDQKKFKDMDGILPYIRNYIIRPIKNFLTGSRDFGVDDSIDADLDSVDLGSDSDGNEL